MKNEAGASMRRGIRCASLVATLAAVSVSSRGVHAGDPPAPRAGAAAPGDVSAEVARHFEAAQAAFARKEYQRAYDAYRAAWALQRSFDIAGNLGVVEVKLGKLRDAAEHLSFAVRNFPPTGQPKQRQALIGKLNEVLPKVGRVRVRVNVDGATVFLNGVEIGTSPLTEEVFVEPVASTLEAKREGYEDARQMVQASAGSSQDVTMTMTPTPRATVEPTGSPGPKGFAGPARPAGPGAPAGAADGQEPPQRSLVPAYVIGGVGGVALVGGLVLIGIAESKRSSAEALSEETGHACPVNAASPQGKCAELAETASSADTFGNVGIAGLVVAGAAAAGVAAYLFWPAAEERPAAGRVRATALAGPGGGGVMVTGSF